MVNKYHKSVIIRVGWLEIFAFKLYLNFLSLQAGMSQLANSFGRLSVEVSFCYEDIVDCMPWKRESSLALGAYSETLQKII